LHIYSIRSQIKRVIYVLKICRPEPEPEVVFLKHVERAKYKTPRSEEEKIYPPPRFIVPLKNISQQEDGRIHFEARIEPIGDPTMISEWFVNGYPLQASKFIFEAYLYGS
jgi:hypothetical protein